MVSLNSRTLTEDSLATLFQTLPRRCIVLLEDIDTAGITQKRTEKKDPKGELTDQANGTSNSNNIQGISLSGLLNVIDGVASSEGRILVMTTNHIDKLDKALRRPGRVDMSIRFGYTDAAAVKGLFNVIYTHLEGDLPGQAVLRRVDTQLHEKGAISSDTQRKLPASASPSSRSFNEKRFHHDHSEEEITSLASQFASIIPDAKFTSAEVQGYLLKHKTNPNAAVAGAAAWVRAVREEKEKKKAEAAEREPEPE
jgi:chaperone BCS1